ncbi:hypothetical protein [Pedobacter sp.]|uniref:hypothetical protein n=1 Tax=Pedobacter sp. TaxID=1411316 RepID=UPI003BAC5235
MRKFIYLFFVLTLSFPAFSQQDTAAYAAQRAKINALLAERSTRFGQYDESLNQRTGIFGWQTKRDIKNSNEILRQVVITDNNIFKELKVLMEYKDLQNQQKVAVADQSQQRMERYMQTIKKLQDQNEQLKAAAESRAKSRNISTYVIVFLLLIMAGGFYFLLKKIEQYKKYEKSNV